MLQVNLRMKCKFLLSTFSFLTLSICASVSTLAGTLDHFNYVLQAKHGVDLSVLSRGPVQLGEIIDQRNNLSGKQISQDSDLNILVAQLIRNAIAQGFAQGGATLVETDPQTILGGELTEFQVETINKDGAQVYQTTVRAKIKLQAANGGQNYWQNSIFGRATVPIDQGMDASVQQALDKFVVGLFIDEYLLIELLD